MVIIKKSLHQKKKSTEKRQLYARRLLKFRKRIQLKKQLKKEHKKKLVPIKRKKQEEANQQIIDYCQKKQENAVDNNEINILNILGFGGGSNNEEVFDWERKLQEKLKQANSKSLDNPEVRRVYGEIGRIFSTYRSGKIPKAFKIIPNLQKWREIILITRPDNWTPQAMYESIKIFSSNFDEICAQQFYSEFLVPAIKNNIKSNKKLNYHYYQALKKALYKTNAWFKGILFQFCNADTLSREISVMESIITKMSIPVISSSVALIKLCQRQPNTAIYHYLKAMISKSYNFPKKIITILCEYLTKFNQYKGQLPVIWQQLFLIFCQQYHSAIDQMMKPGLIQLAKKHYHKFITPEIVKELS